MSVVQSAGETGYRDQLDRVRRFLHRMQDAHEGEVEFQDMAWSFFQQCWHLKDWLRHDPLVPPAVKDTVLRKVGQSITLGLCEDLCCANRRLSAPGTASRAASAHYDCVVDDGRGSALMARSFAQACVAEWEVILHSCGLATAPRV